MSGVVAVKSDLSERALIVRLTINSWRGRKYDKEVSKEVSDNHAAEQDAGRYNKALIDKDTMNALNRIASDARRAHYRLTLPWKDNGDRIIASTMFLQYAKEMRVHEAAWNKAVTDFLAVYPSRINEAKTRLGTMFKASDYPSVSELAARFGFDVDTEPVPSASDFRAGGLDQNQLAELQADIEKRTRNALKSATTDIYVRLHEVVNDMVERLKSFKKSADGKSEKTFRDTVVTNIEDLLSVVPALNAVAQDDRIDAFVARIKEELTQYRPETLRENDTARLQVLEAAQQIESLMSQFI